MSSDPDSGYSEQRLAEDVLRVLDAMKISAPVLVGHSMAGEEMTRLGAEHSDRLGGLVYLDAAADPADFPASNPAYMDLFRKLPEPMRSMPSPAPSDRKSFSAYHEWWVRTGRIPFPESELRNQYESNADGSVGRFRSSQRIHDAIGAGAQKRDYTNISVPVLALFDAPCSRQPEGNDACVEYPVDASEYQPANDEERAARDAFVASTIAYFDRWKKNLRNAKGGVRLVDLPRAGHYLFFTREADVLRELRAFVAVLNERRQ